MDTVIGANTGRKTRAGQDETSPIPLEVMLSRALGRASQDETSPFPLDVMVIADARRASRDETCPFPLEHRVALPEGNGAGPRAPSRQRTRGKAVPRQTLHAVEPSRELRAYAARLARGEALPPYRGPVLAGEKPAASKRPRAQPQAAQACRPALAPAARERAPVEPVSCEPLPVEPVSSEPLPVEPPSVEPRASHPSAESELVPPARVGAQPSRAQTLAKLALGLLLSTGVVVAAAVAGDDAQLRAAGDSIGRWLTGRDTSFQSFPSSDPASSPCNAVRADERSGH